MKMLTLALTAVALTLATGEPARGSPVSRPAAPQTQDFDAFAALLRGWLAEIAAWGQLYDGVTTSRADTLERMMTEPADMLDKVEAGDLAGAKAWAAAWAPEIRRLLAADMKAYNALPPQMPPFPNGVPLLAEHQVRIQMMSEVPDRIRALLISTGQSAEVYIRLVEAAAGGDVADIERLGVGSYTLIAAQLEAEIVMLEALRGDSGPVYDFRTAMIEANKAMIVWMLFEQSVGFGGDADPAVAAAAIRSHAAEVRAAAIRMDQGVDALEERTVGDAEFQDTGLGRVFTSVFESMRESAEVEKRIAAELGRLAAVLKTNDAEAIDEVALQIENLTIRRIELDTERRRIMAENGG